MASLTMGHEFGQAPAVGDEQRVLAEYSAAVHGVAKSQT